MMSWECHRAKTEKNTYVHIDGQTHRHAHTSDQCMCSDKKKIQKKHFWIGTKAQQNHNSLLCYIF